MKAFELFATLGLDSGPFAKGLNAAENLGSKFGSGVAKASKFVAGAIGAATAATGAFAVSSVKTGEEFDKAMSQVAATMGYTVDDLNTEGSEASKTFTTLRDFAQQMGQTTAFSATEASEALNFMALAGYDAEKSMQMLPNVLNLAASGGMELATASDMVTDAQSALGLSMDQTTDMVDQMAKTASKSNTSVSQLGEAILTIGPTAKYMAGGTDRLNTVLGILANNGIKGSEAGTHLRNMLMKLSSPTKEGQKLLKKFGKTLGHDLVFDKKTGEMRDMQDIMQDLGKAMSGMTDEQKIKTISELFNARDVASVNALLNTTTKEWNDLGAAIVDSKGAADEMAKVQLDNLNGDITLFKSALEGAKIAVSDQLTPSIREFVQFGTKGVSELTQAFSEGGLSGMMGKFGELLAEGLNKIVEVMPSAIEAGTKLLESVVQGIVDNLPQIGQAFLGILPMLLTAGVSMITTIITGIANAMPELVKTATDVLGQMVATLTNPQTLATILDAGGTILLELGKGIADSIPTLISGAANVILSLAGYFTDPTNLSRILDTAAEIIIKLANGLAENAPTLIPKVIEVILALAEAFTEPDRLVSIVAAGLNMGLQILKGLVDSIPQIIAAIPKLIANIFSAITQAIPVWLEAMKTEFTLIWDGVKSVFAGVGEWFNGKFEEAWTLVQEAWAGVVEWFTTLWTNISTVFAGVAMFFSKIFNGAWSAITGALKGAVKWFTDLWSNISAAFDGVVAFFTQIFSDAWAAIETAWSTVSEFFTGIWDGVKAVFDPVIQWFDKTFGDAWGKIKGVFSGVRNWFKTNVFDKIIGVFGSIGDSFWNIGENILTGLWNGIQAAWAWVKEKIESIGSWILSIFGVSLDIHSPSRKMRDKIGKNIMLGLAEGMTQNLGAVEDATEKTLGALPNPDSRRFRYQVQENFTASMGGITDKMGDMFSNFEQTVVLKLNDRELGRAVRGYV